MFEKPYVERLAEVFDKMPVDHDCRDQKASNLNRWNFYGKQHTECKQSESHDVSERMWPIHAQGMYKIFSFIVTLRQVCGVMYKNMDAFL